MNDWKFPHRMVRDVYRADSSAGVDYIEIGFHGTAAFFDPKRYGTWRFSPEADVRSVTDGISGSRIALMVDYGKFKVEDIPPKRESVVDLVRIAVHRDGVREAAEQATAIKLKGYEVSLNLMGIATYSADERRELVGILSEVPVDFAYIGDTYGSILPDDIAGLVELMRSLGDFKVGFHPHNNLQMAFANTLEAMRCGIDIVDGSLFGIGRGAGNLPLETLVAYLQTKEPERYNALPLMNMVDRYLVDMQRETPWGYRLPYMMSGMFNVHPNYALQMLDSHEYTVVDIW
jgi:4-hydroxy 2-oxovalerate aldolase